MPPALSRPSCPSSQPILNSVCEPKGYSHHSQGQGEVRAGLLPKWPRFAPVHPFGLELPRQVHYSWRGHIETLTLQCEGMFFFLRSGCRTDRAIRSDGQKPLAFPGPWEMTLKGAWPERGCGNSEPGLEVGEMGSDGVGGVSRRGETARPGTDREPSGRGVVLRACPPSPYHLLWLPAPQGLAGGSSPLLLFQKTGV